MVEQVKTPIAILVSGRGTNMIALAEACQDEHFPADIVTVISNTPDSPALTMAEDMGINVKILEPGEEFESDLMQELMLAEAEMVCLAGFSQKLSADFLINWRGRVLSVQGSLLPAFPGPNPQKQAIDAGVRVSGCTVYVVDTENDRIPIITQRAVPVHFDDTILSLSDRILEAEHKCYCEAVRLVASGRVEVRDGRVIYVSQLET